MAVNDSGRARIAISSAFNENAIRAISDVAWASNRLVRRVTRSADGVASAINAAQSYLPVPSLLSRYASRQIAKVATQRLPVDKEIAPFSDLIRIVGGRRRSPLSHRMGNATWKLAYDRQAACADYSDADVLVSLPGSSLRTFAANRSRFRVLHQIDAHPRVRNEALQTFYGKRRAVAEMYPNDFVLRIEDEIAAANLVLVPSKDLSAQMRSRGVEDARILRVPYGVDPGVFSIRKRADRSGAGDRLIVVCTAQISLRKGIPFLLEAVRAAPVELQIVGPVFDREIVRNVPDNVRLLGAVSAAELAEIYSQADLFVLPSIEDAFGLVVAEAAAAGLPIVTTFNTGAHELVGEQGTVVEAGDAAALRDAILSYPILSSSQRECNARLAREARWMSWDDYGQAVLSGIDSRWRA